MAVLAPPAWLTASTYCDPSEVPGLSPSSSCSSLESLSRDGSSTVTTPLSSPRPSITSLEDEFYSCDVIQGNLGASSLGLDLGNIAASLDAYQCTFKYPSPCEPAVSSSFPKSSLYAETSLWTPEAAMPWSSYSQPYSSSLYADTDRSLYGYGASKPSLSQYDRPLPPQANWTSSRPTPLDLPTFSYASASSSDSSDDEVDEVEQEIMMAAAQRSRQRQLRRSHAPQDLISPVSNTFRSATDAQSPQGDPELVVSPTRFVHLPRIPPAAGPLAQREMRKWSMELETGVGLVVYPNVNDRVLNGAEERLRVCILVTQANRLYGKKHWASKRAADSMMRGNITPASFMGGL